MPVLHLGVIDVPYVDHTRPSKRSRKTKSTEPKTTGDVAERLEGTYHIMRVFYDQHKRDVALALESSLAGTLESLLMGAPSSISPFGEGTFKIETTFKKFLEQKEMDRMGLPGIPTMASLLGISHRFKGKRGPPRPSFIDTGLYEASFKAWVD